MSEFNEWQQPNQVYEVNPESIIDKDMFTGPALYTAVVGLSREYHRSFRDYSLILKSNPRRSLYEFYGYNNNLHFRMMWECPDRQVTAEEVKDQITFIRKEEDPHPLQLYFDTYSDYYNAPGLEFLDKGILFLRYFSTIKEMMLKGGMLVVQLTTHNSQNPQDDESIYRHNEQIKLLLFSAGFDPDKSRIIKFKKQDGSTGILYLLEQQDLTKGEPDTHVDTKEKIPEQQTATAKPGVLVGV